jgi:cytochrome c-type biogenesis protein CcmH/NrfG
MSRHPVSMGGRADAAEYKQELLGRLGLRADASDQDVEAAHNGVVEFLELAPHEVKSWAAVQTTDVDEAFALLSGPEQDLVPAAQVTTMAQVSLDQVPPPPSPIPPATPATPSAPPGVAGSATNKPLQKKLTWVLAPLLVLGVILGVYFKGQNSDVPGISGTPTGTETTAAAGGATTTPVDPTKVAALMKKISANPKDTASLQALGDIYFAAADYKNASAWEQKIIGVDPKNQVALLALGAGQFNLGNALEAKKTWLVASSLYPKNAEVHYDLGFLYMSQTPPDSAKMQAEWKEVVAIDPNSDLAKTVATHLKSSTASPTVSATPAK